jgi:hypothetical protein
LNSYERINVKRILSSIVGLLLVAGMAFAAVSVVDKLSFSATGQSATWTLPAKAGNFWDVDLMAYVATGGNITVYCPIKESKLAITSAGGTSLSIYTTSSNVLDGVTISADDFILIDNAGTYTLANISATGVYTNNISEFTVGAFTATAGAKVYLCELADILTIPVEATVEQYFKGLVVGKLGMPLHFVGGAAVGPSSVYCGVANATKP